MVNYCTRVDIPRSPFDISYQNGLMFLGSCFADQIGSRMTEHGWHGCVNPFGILYNPLSVALGCRRILNPEPFTAADLFEHDGMVHSFMHHGKFSDCEMEAALAKINGALSEAADYFRKVSCLVITFGTAYAYRLKSDGRVVANCHKIPASQFSRELLTVNQITDEWSDLLAQCRWVNPMIKIIFTVSPIRHWKNGAHDNQISKSVLLLAEQALMEKYAGMTSYFPAYELMMDELRDYRFYAEDLLHPSKIAVDYIWERFCDVYMNAGTRDLLKEVESIHRDLLHRPFNPATETYKRFLLQTMSKIKRLHKKNPYICMSNVERELTDRLQGLSKK